MGTTGGVDVVFNFPLLVIVAVIILVGHGKNLGKNKRCCCHGAVAGGLP